MREFFERLRNQIRAWWTGLAPAQRTVALILAGVLAIAIGMLVFATARPNYTYLYTNLKTEDAGNVVQELKAQRVPYKTSAGGTAILVPEKAVHDTRLSLAAKGIPKHGGVGFEIFDKQKFGVTDFEQKVNYQRALQTELRRTIEQLSPVRSAEVMLALPPQELFIEKEKDATASVVLEMKEGSKLQAEQVRGIIYLVSRSVVGLKPENVHVVDVEGASLSDAVKDDILDQEYPGRPSGLGMSGTLSSGKGMTSLDGKITIEQQEYERRLHLTQTQIQMQADFERSLERRLLSMLEKAIGPNKVTVRVTTMLDFNKHESKAEIFEPVVGGQGILRSQQKKDEAASGVGVPHVAPGGVPGTTSNIPGYQAFVQGFAGNLQYSKKEEINNWEINRREENTISAPGKVRRLTVGVLVDDLQPQQVDGIKAAVAAAAGVDMSRGDVVTVESMPFNRDTLTQAQLKMRDRDAQAQVRRWWSMFFVFGLGILLVILLYLSLRKPKEAPLLEGIPVEEALKDIESEEVLEEQRRAQQRLLDEQRRTQIKTQIIKLARERPQDIAEIIKSWLTERKR